MAVRGLLSVNKNINPDAWMERALDEFHLLPKLHQVKNLINSGCNINEKNDMGETALYFAAYFGKQKILEYLFSCVDLQVMGEYRGESELHAAARAGHIECLRLCLKNGSYIDAQSLEDNWTALHIACFRKDTNIIRLLMENKANTNVVAHYGYKPINLLFILFDPQAYLIVRCLDTDLILQCMEELLVSPYVDVNHWSFIPGRTGPFVSANPTPLERACGIVSPDLVRLLLNNGARADGIYQKSCVRIPLLCLFHLLDTLSSFKLDTCQKIQDFQRCIELLLCHGIKNDVMQLFTRPKDYRKKTVAGARLRTITNIRQQIRKKNMEEYFPEYLKSEWKRFLSWLQFKENNVSSLKSLVRMKIRETVGHRVQCHVKELPIPRLLKECVLLYDI
ncbi:ankyrin repeat and SOCS box protein 3 isoform X2 [Lingula anatina]|uniref:Ankyrin repeat and SOCS box protein 3 isoform X2 n=1 Tax=Lingula anatina TaxID=7574 RepID=A0A1S3K1X1_LINAN|nr:ankyrin repeat and SOCS box protein 3 isoform X2 [Lingula anatina]|eukprot:XP_013416625.1 ankyrin repeat and SOCS box protein 3 isoform X2 [Lingula anatina]